MSKDKDDLIVMRDNRKITILCIRVPTCAVSVFARAKLSCEEKVLLPTPPLPDKIRILCFTLDSRSVIAGMSGSGPLGVDRHSFWLGQPWQVSS